MHGWIVGVGVVVVWLIGMADDLAFSFWGGGKRRCPPPMFALVGMMLMIGYLVDDRLRCLHNLVFDDC